MKKEHPLTLKTGLWIAVEVLNDKKLTVNHKMLLSEIHEQTRTGKGICKSPNVYMRTVLGLPETSVRDGLKFLERKGYIAIVSDLRVRKIYVIVDYLEKYHEVENEKEFFRLNCG